VFPQDGSGSTARASASAWFGNDFIHKRFRNDEMHGPILAFDLEQRIRVKLDENLAPDGPRGT
jgi:hypothetical protein